MKRAALILLCAVLMGSLSACSGGNEPESSSIPSPSETVIEDMSSDFDYVAMAEDVGPIAASALWQDPAQIPVRDLLGWYVRCILATNSGDPSALDPYLSEDAGSYQIPAGEFEEAVKTYFGLEKDHLEAAADLYDSENQIYSISLSQIKQAACTVQQVEIAGNMLQIYFTLNTGSENSGSSNEKVYNLTVDTSDGIRFVSCTEADPSALKSDEGTLEGETDEVDFNSEAQSDVEAPSSSSEGSAVETDTSDAATGEGAAEPAEAGTASSEGTEDAQ